MNRNKNKYNGNTVKYARISGIWRQMNYRCYNPKAENYQRYGGKGVTVCDEWRNDFNSFLHWALSNGYEDGLTLDRIDSSKPYSPENCRWATYFTQEQNKGASNRSSTGIRGVYKYDKYYKVEITRDKNRKFIGRFKTLKEAIEARERAEQIYEATGTL